MRRTDTLRLLLLTMIGSGCGVVTASRTKIMGVQEFGSSGGLIVKIVKLEESKVACTATLVDSTGWYLTAAHCFSELGLEEPSQESHPFEGYKIAYATSKGVISRKITQIVHSIPFSEMGVRESWENYLSNPFPDKLRNSAANMMRRDFALVKTRGRDLITAKPASYEVSHERTPPSLPTIVAGYGLSLPLLSCAKRRKVAFPADIGNLKLESRSMGGASPLQHWTHARRFRWPDRVFAR